MSADPLRIRAKIQQMEEELARLRQELRVSDRNEMVAKWEPDIDELILVIADGLGGATVQRSAGNYPIDHLVHDEQHFEQERDACQAAEQLFEGKIQRLTEFNLGTADDEPTV